MSANTSQSIQWKCPVADTIFTEIKEPDRTGDSLTYLVHRLDRQNARGNLNAQFHHGPSPHQRSDHR